MIDLPLGENEPSNDRAILVRSLDGRITFWSPAMERRYGFTSEEAVGKVAHQLLGTTSWQAWDEIQNELLKQAFGMAD